MDDYSATSGNITTENGNLTSNAGGVCGFSWSAQAVLDADLPNPSTNGFLESVWPTPGGDEMGNGHLSIQHWFSGGDQLAWRIPIALDRAVGDAHVTLVFDDPDWTVDPASLQQYSDWTVQPGHESAFHRFTGISGYAPHDDNQVLPATWGTDGAGHTTLMLELGMIEPHTSTVIGFTGSAASSLGMTGAQNIAAGVAYGTKLTVNGVRPLAECYSAGYAATAVQAGQVGAVTPVAVDGYGNTIGALPTGTVFSLTAGSPVGLQIDPVTGLVSWSVRSDHSGGIVDIPVTITYPDHGDFAAGSHSTTIARFDVAVRTPVLPPAIQTPIPSESDNRLITELATPVLPQILETKSFDPVRPDPVRQPQVVRPAIPLETQPVSTTAPIITLEVTGSPLLPLLYVALGGLVLGIAGAFFLLRAKASRGSPR
ncbi:MAG: Rib/alpha-like domain-containing protein [Leucobacter sp.]